MSSRSDVFYRKVRDFFELNGDIQLNAAYGALSALAVESGFILVASVNV